jgi:hypothetical protein
MVDASEILRWPLLALRFSASMVSSSESQELHEMVDATVEAESLRLPLTAFGFSASVATVAHSSESQELPAMGLALLEVSSKEQSESSRHNCREEGSVFLRAGVRSNTGMSLGTWMNVFLTNGMCN